MGRGWQGREEKGAGNAAVHAWSFSLSLRRLAAHEPGARARHCVEELVLGAAGHAASDSKSAIASASARARARARALARARARGRASARIHRLRSIPDNLLIERKPHAK